MSVERCSRSEISIARSAGPSVLRRSRHVGHWKITQRLEITALAFNLVRMRRLLAAWRAAPRAERSRDADRGPNRPPNRRLGDARPRISGFDTSEAAREETNSGPRGGSSASC
jgi:hypothetical protein